MIWLSEFPCSHKVPGSTVQHDEVKFDRQALAWLGRRWQLHFGKACCLYETSHRDLHCEVVRVRHRVLFFDLALGFY